ncbi:PAS domain-containing protein [Dyadobacter frigoris]|uniref:PAS domain-containing protein n=1 Tax=Dyadobacter frigoris TaxID=2576211 RepID=UPI0021D27391|nr:PAS domain-containing protein [Dyadobacter frigoris]
MYIMGQITLAIKQGHFFDIELRILTANQNLKWVRVIGEPEFENGKCVRISGSFQDIDVRKIAEFAAIEGLAEKNIIVGSIGSL